ncbi:putative ATP-binding protein involved in virulence [Rivularia sp. PCC 7116]|uniref:AAA family ATPase n=1 Tax=Rivularia sp. PCC 7116 TaxID=373994 RepID=UPI00029EDA6A|nr:AAA family ATPase [Rivularia sp. PCC 7116]AFY54522.1 putative ATP-binding protein involved in virulence [Rivularia sp. PCC 7116]
MKIKRIEMQSFRGIGDMALEFQEDEPNVIIGINGVGKSSILECIAILLSRYTKPVQFPTTSGRLFQEEDISTGSEETRNEITVETDEGEVTWCLSKQRKKRSKTVGSDLSELRKLIDETHEQLKNDSEFNLPVIVHYGVNRAVLEIPLRGRKKNSNERASAYEQSLDSVQINFNSFFQWFRKLEDLENEQRLDDSNFVNHQLEAVRQAIYSLITGLSNLRIRRSPLRMTVKKQDRELNVNQLSDGEKCLLAMVGDLARRLAIANPGLEDPLLGDGIVLIDEIELHLHPRWQRDIIPALKKTFPNCQFIVTTHSPQVISHVRAEGVFILERDEEQGLIIMSPEGSYGRDSNSILEDLMEVPERPQKIKDSLQELFRFIDDGNLEGAKELREELASEIGDDEPEFVRADVLIRRKEILNK